MTIIPFAKRRIQTSPATPLDFHRFQHQEEDVLASDRKTVISRPLWVVGSSPFDPVLADDGGHVVHLGKPGFTARWSMNENTIASVDRPAFHDEDLDLIIYEVLLIDGHAGPIDSEWLEEAACAVAYWKGLIAAVEPEEVH